MAHIPVGCREKEAPPMLRVVEKPTGENQELRTTLDELLQRGALQMLHQAPEAEVEDYITRHRGARDDCGRAQVVRNGKAPARQLVTGSGTLEVRAPRVNDRRVDAGGQRQRFTSEILPSYMRRAPKVTEVLPILYLRGLSTGDFQAALPVLLGEDAAGLSPTTITRLTGCAGVRFVDGVQSIPTNAVAEKNEDAA